MVRFTHLHVHTQYSLLDGVASVDRLLQRCRDTGMESLAMTDHGNMYGICHFVEAAKKYNIKPIVGCEFYVAKEDRFDRTDSRRYHQILLAKDKQGYDNLCTLSSLSFIDGYYYKPRIDKKLLRQYHEGLIATTACMAGFVNQALLHSGEEDAEKELLELYDIFKDDFYLELQRFANAEQERCNQFLLKMSKKHGIKVIATNDVHYVTKEESVSHDILLCIQTGADYNDPDRMRFAADTFYLKSPAEMLEAFCDHPEAIENTQEVADKCWLPELMREIILPQYDVPAGFSSQVSYLRFLTIEGSKKRFKQITPAVESRIDYELSMIDKMGFVGYFLIVQDYISAARRLGVSVGTGRGSVCGSIVAYCIGITDINPLDYGLFFERFLNPERISMPDIDIDFEDNGREKVIDYVINKYGKDHVAHLVTFGTMAAKVAIKDVARVLGMSFEHANKLTKLIPFKLPAPTLKESIPLIPELKALYDKVGSLEHTILFHASILEGCKRQTGLHACGIIIAPDQLIHCLPVKTDKETDLLVTQYEGSLVDHVGMLKMDFLGLKTLTIIKNTIKMIKRHHGVDIDINNIDLNDKKVLKLFGGGNTVGVFQFESDGMRAWLKKLRPDNIEDLIAMNALFRPGPMQFIDNFIKRKHGQQKIEYPHPLLEPILKNTYGIIVYQEQVMQVAQTIAGYSLAQADILRKAMGKKKPDEMAKQRIAFTRGCEETHNISQKESNDIFDMMETFAQYGFNKSHAAAYSVIAFQTAYLKTYYPTEFMAASLINAQGTTEAITPLLQDCQRMRIQIKGPSVNTSNYDFDVGEEGEICYGLAGIKGVGESSARCIIETRERHGKFNNIFDFSESIDLRAVNKKTFESLALSGAFDCLNSGNRRQYIISTNDGTSFIEQIISYVGKVKAEEEEMKNSLFGDLGQFNIMSTPRPKMPNCIEYPQIDLLNFEKEYIGFYISGHPLERYKKIIDKYCNCSSIVFQQKGDDVDVEVCRDKCIIAGIVSDMRIKMSKRDTPYGVVTLEDFEGELTFSIFGETFTKYKDMFKVGAAVVCVGYVTSKYNDPDRLEFKCNKVFDMITLENNFSN
ncbi:MAG: DNA polymerase III subunit alpha [Cytophagales bacterium]|nr:DNA polymerase III subunit alpha [Cytophagales bacterium]